MAEANVTWTEELKQELVDAYKERSPTAENTVEITKALAEEFEASVNAIRMILIKAGVYIKKEPDAKGASAKSGGSTSTRVSKADAIQSLVSELENCGEMDVEIDQEIIDKLTGKAALYFATVIKKINKAS